MLFVSEDAPRRPGYVYEPAPGGGYIGYPEAAIPYVDGPFLIMRNGEAHYLTLWERFILAIGWTDVFALEKRRRTNKHQSTS
jgi:hypothetical protein